MLKKIEEYTSSKFERIKEKFDGEKNKSKPANEVSQETSFSKSLKRTDVNPLKPKDPLLEEISKKVIGKLSFLKAHLRDEEGNFGIKPLIMKRRDKLNEFFHCKTEEIVLKLCMNVPKILKRSLKDPDMFDFVKKMVDDLVDEMWPEIQENILYNIKLKIDKPLLPTFPERNFPIYLLPVEKIRSWYLYTKSPFDKSIWGQLRDINWWFLTFLTVIPSFGIQPFVFVINFGLMDRKDEYQLVKYIVEYKRMQFFANGFLGSLIGFIAYFKCSTLTNKNTPIEEIIKCNQLGPGSSINIFLDGFGFILQLVLLWSAFLLLPFSEERGELKFRNHSKNEKNLKDKEIRWFMGKIPYTLGRGGRLYLFMIYDLLMFVVSLSILIFLFIIDAEKDIWRFKAKLFFAKTIYGLFSLPFVIFLIEPLTLLLTSSKVTAYDKRGNTLPKLKSLAVLIQSNEKKSNEKKLKEEKEMKELLSTDVNELFEDDFTK